MNSSKYSPDCAQPKFSYEAIEFTVVEDDKYMFGTTSQLDTVTYLYENKFNPFDPFTNRFNGDDGNGYITKTRLYRHLQNRKTYILVVTTYANETGSFTLTAFGPTSITLKHIGECRCAFIRILLNVSKCIVSIR